ncbi:hypothetical protein BDK51DRAFT_40062 [Blyttiomyces helicus]|uniref:Uncharacterized protein n=1 Tax=Blyttiomyces helicus TaxID=388810 RepID=A0A4P9W9Q0_9FUNG|nr:hypothetical protein BDK51DRAFT_40062 [Blyttiomyces helicus]|eukprot:RKO86946.1 hypothetical protein BDK51DRAFT_40062 [Blyttiomyces helicus]
MRRVHSKAEKSKPMLNPTMVSLPAGDAATSFPDPLVRPPHAADHSGRSYCGQELAIHTPGVLNAQAYPSCPSSAVPTRQGGGGGGASPPTASPSPPSTSSISNATPLLRKRPRRRRHGSQQG